MNSLHPSGRILFLSAKVVAVITEREPVQRILAHLGLPSDAPPVARARDPTDELDDDEAKAQLSLDLVSGFPTRRASA